MTLFEQRVRSNLTTTEKARLSITFLVAYALLAFSYSVEISPKWASTGFVYDPSLPSVVFSILLLVCFPFVVSLTRDFRSLLLVFSLFVCFIPALVFLDFARRNFIYSLSIVVSLLIISVLSRMPIPRLRTPVVNPSAWIIFVALAIGFFSLDLLRAAGLSRFSLDLFSVYESRRDVAGTIGGSLNRMASIVSKLLIPLLIVLSFHLKDSRRYFVLAFALVCSVLIFGIWQHKSALFMPFTVFVMCVYMRRGDAMFKLANLFLFFFVLLSAEAAYNYLWNVETAGILNNLATRRAFFVPALLNFNYIDYYSTSEYFGWYSLTQHFGVRPPATLTPPAFLIGLEYFDSYDMSANAGFIASGFTNAGLLGITIYASLIGLMVAFVNSYSRKLSAPMIFALSITSFHTVLASSDLITALLSHGFLLYLVVLPLLPRHTSES